MSKRNLKAAAQSKGVLPERAKAVFEQFQEYEDWKKTVEQALSDSRKIGTTLGNHYHISCRGQISAKQKRSAVSQVVQGTGSLIFKRALIKIGLLSGFRLLIPLHDAVLIEHKPNKDPQLVLDAMENAMTETLDGKVTGKASISQFS